MTNDVSDLRNQVLSIFGGQGEDDQKRILEDVLATQKANLTDVVELLLKRDES